MSIEVAGRQQLNQSIDESFQSKALPICLEQIDAHALGAIAMQSSEAMTVLSATCDIDN